MKLKNLTLKQQFQRKRKPGKRIRVNERSPAWPVKALDPARWKVPVLLIEEVETVEMLRWIPLGEPGVEMRVQHLPSVEKVKNAQGKKQTEKGAEKAAAQA